MSLSEALPTTAIDTVSEFKRKALQATVNEGLAKGPYMAARASMSRSHPSTQPYYMSKLCLIVANICCRDLNSLLS